VYHYLWTECTAMQWLGVSVLSHWMFRYQATWCIFTQWLDVALPRNEVYHSIPINAQCAIARVWESFY